MSLSGLKTLPFTYQVYVMQGVPVPVWRVFSYSKLVIRGIIRVEKNILNVTANSAGLGADLWGELLEFGRTP